MRPESPLQNPVADASTANLRAGDTARTPAASAAQPQVAGYEILDELGRGGMGVVYRARQESLGRIVALKVLVAGQHAGAELIARFRAEAEVVARLQHPNIVQVYEVGATAGHPFLSLEFLSGGSLADKLKHQPLSPRDGAALVRTLALAVQAAHDAHIVHRDLKPANILLAADGSPKIADFGLAKQLGGTPGATHTGDILGTPGYMSPEQASGVTQAIGPACDIYSLGAILYELLTGGPPFRGHDPMEVILQVRSQEPVAPGRLAPQTPRDLETIALRCLEKQPGKRFLTAQALADDLSRYLEGHPIQARCASTAEKVWKWARRRPALAALVAVSIFSLATFVAYGVWKNRQLAQALETTAQARDRAEGNLRRAIDAAARRITRAGDASANPLLEELTFMEHIRSQTGDEPAVRHERALAAGWAGYIHSELNDASAAERAFNESVTLLTDLAEQFPKNYVYRRDRANFVARYGAFLARSGDNEGAQREYAKALALFEELLADTPDDVDCRVLLATECNNLAIVTGLLGGDAEPYHRRALKLRQKLVEEFPNDRGYRYDLTVSQMNLSTLKLRQQRYAEAEQVLRDCLGELAAAPAKLKAESEYRRTLAATHLNLGYALEFQQKPAEAAAAYLTGANELERLVEVHPQSVALRTMLIDALNNLSKLLIGQGQYAEAIAPVERVVNLHKLLLQEFPDNPQYAAALAGREQTLEQLRKAASGAAPE